MGLQLLAFLGVFALLIGNAAAGLASRLAGSLAFAAAAVLGAFAQIAGLDRLDVLHDANLPYDLYDILPYLTVQVNTNRAEEKYLMSETIPLYGIKKKAYTVTDLM